MSRIFREPDCFAAATSPDDIAQVLRHARPGRFIVEEVAPAGKLLPSGPS